MKKKLLLTIYTLCCALALVFGLSACNKSDDSGNSGDNETPPIQTPNDDEQPENKNPNEPSGSENPDDTTDDEQGENENPDKPNEQPEKGITVNGVIYLLNSDETAYSAIGVTDKNVTKILIPSSVNGLPVTSIGKQAFENCTALTSITIPDGMTSIGDYAFRGCSIETATVPTTFISSIPKSNLKTVVFTSGKSIADGAFYDCTTLTSVTIPNSITRIGLSAFAACNSLERVNITDLTAWCKISFGDSYANPLYYAHNLYLNGSPLTSAAIPNGVTSIGKYAFAGYTSLTSITIPNSVTSIDFEAFENCSSLTGITIPNSVKSIASSAFFGCSALETITVATGNSRYHSAGNCLIETAAKSLVLGCKNSVIPSDETVTNIGANAFNGCTSLTSITIPDSVKIIGNSAFYGCSSLASITVPDSVTSIGYGTFAHCTSLTNITFQGTKAEWNAIVKEDRWNTDTGNYTIHCTDGNIAKE